MSVAPLRELVHFFEEDELDTVAISSCGIDSRSFIKPFAMRALQYGKVVRLREQAEDVRSRAARRYRLRCHLERDKEYESHAVGVSRHPA